MDKPCKRCGKIFSAPPSEMKRRVFCSKNCSGNRHVDLEVVQLLRSIPDFPPMTFEEIGELSGVSKQDIERIYIGALAKMKDRLMRLNNGESLEMEHRW